MTTNQTIDGVPLLPCPFCGCQVTFLTGPEDYRIAGSHLKACPFLDVDVVVDSWAAWNSRAELRALLDEPAKPYELPFGFGPLVDQPEWAQIQILKNTVAELEGDIEKLHSELAVQPQGVSVAFQWRCKTVNEGSQWRHWVDCTEEDYNKTIENPGPTPRGIIREARKLYAEQPATFQARVKPWMLACFGEVIAADRQERNHRFLEEALELVQSNQCTAIEAHQLVDYVYGRPVGDPAQEVGGVMITLAALCLASGLDMHAAGETELARIWTKVEQIRAKQAAKPAMSPLPGAYPDREQPAPVAVLPERLQQVLKFLDGAENLDGHWFGEPHPSGRSYWWRAELRKAIDETNLFAKQQ